MRRCTCTKQMHVNEPSSLLASQTCWSLLPLPKSRFRQNPRCRTSQESRVTSHERPGGFRWSPPVPCGCGSCCTCARSQASTLRFALFMKSPAVPIPKEVISPRPVLSVFKSQGKQSCFWGFPHFENKAVWFCATACNGSVAVWKSDVQSTSASASRIHVGGEAYLNMAVVEHV